MHCIVLHCTVLHCNVVHCIVLHCTVVHYTLLGVTGTLAVSNLVMGSWGEIRLASTWSELVLYSRGFSVQCTVYSVQCTVYSVQCTVGWVDKS